MEKRETYLSHILNFKKEYYGINKAIERVICNISNVGLGFIFVVSFIVAFINISDQKLMDSIIEAIKINDSNIADILVSCFLGFYFLLVFSLSTMPLKDKIDKYYVNRRSEVEWNLLVKSKLIESNLIKFVDIKDGINSLLLYKLLPIYYKDSFLLYKTHFESMNIKDLKNSELILYKALMNLNPELEFKYKNECNEFILVEKLE